MPAINKTHQLMLFNEVSFITTSNDQTKTGITYQEQAREKPLNCLGLVSRIVSSMGIQP